MIEKTERFLVHVRAQEKFSGIVFPVSVSGLDRCDVSQWNINIYRLCIYIERFGQTNPEFSPELGFENITEDSCTFQWRAANLH